jgi:hypothetical protein
VRNAEDILAARLIDPSTAHCVSGFWGEDFGDQRLVSRTFIWCDPVEGEVAPEAVMQDVWCEQLAEWDELRRRALARTT